MLRQAGDNGAGLIVLPELWTTGYALKQLPGLADPAPALSLLRETAMRDKLWIVAGSVIEKDRDCYYNTAYVINHTGEVAGKFRKCHLFGPMGEDRYFSPGNETCVVDSPYGKIGVLICYDLRFPELALKTVDLGARILVIPAEWPHPRLDHWQTLNRARAIENQVFILACNRVGTTGRTHFCGNSMIIDPWGQVLANGGETEVVITAQLDLDQVDAVRAAIPCWADRQRKQQQRTMEG